MDSMPDEIVDRAIVEHRRPPGRLDADRMWIAEDPTTDCSGVGTVEREAVGNLVAAVVEYERGEGDRDPLLKLPGKTVSRPSPYTDTSSMFDRLQSLF
ncbi:hypothetical protein [Haloarcula halophila]|uniref:hypothetical protein n=1 Tax=Haloarcula TaxID=2237 RepID=UPI0023E3A701|nr:hypothetical protein [Halomicroarcula sp. DFY41]